MGLLDDAIREHLELKRRRGTDPTEVDRLEREALGPVRRPGQEPEDVPLDDDFGPEARYSDEEPVQRWAESPQAPEFFDARDELVEDEEDSEEWDVPEHAPVQGGLGVEPDVAAPAPPAPPTPASPEPGRAGLYEDEHFDQETLEHSVNDEELGPEEGRDPADRPPPAESDDMLEETPEFLQDTPDHDRLWFEQRPPRDFDLDS